ncbi:hypothetical protein [Adlercreutzia sp. ZJ141]|uniref:hypothetical protein n=1 Tax=Adlercreutzia sp. ZJ141 TaxID=2709406 RepID=UPI0013ED39B8|nr:hypothetical protein [Adlercreutzia sp. ZJ141]
MEEHDIYVMRECVRAWMHHIRALDADIRDAERRIRTIRERAEGVAGVSFDDITSGGQGCSTADMVVQLVDLEREWSELVRANHAEVAAAKRMCSAGFLGRRAMWLHEVDGLTWNAVGDEIGYSAKQACRIADGGVRELYPMIPEQFKSGLFPDAVTM